MYNVYIIYIYCAVGEMEDKVKELQLEEKELQMLIHRFNKAAKENEELEKEYKFLLEYHNKVRSLKDDSLQLSQTLDNVQQDMNALKKYLLGNEYGMETTTTQTNAKSLVVQSTTNQTQY